MSMRALPELRFIIRDGKHILQQRFALPYTYKDTHGELQLDYDYEWRDVPLVESPPRED